MKAWRLLDEGPAPGPVNMAIDEALLRARKPEDPPVLRFYSWTDDTLSLGRFQRAADFADQGLPRVRRVTSGGALIHRRDELTYALIAPYKTFGDRKPRAAYNAVHAIIAAGLAALGVAADKRGAEGPKEKALARFCYDRGADFDLVTSLGKLVGSAQHRRGRAFLQHGSIPLAADPRVEGATSLEELLGERPARAAVLAALRGAFEQGAGIRLEASELTAEERDLAGALEAERYANRGWTFER